MNGKTLNEQMLGAHDTIDDDQGFDRVAFCTLFGSSFIEVIVIHVLDSRFRLWHCALPPSADYMLDFADAWSRCSRYIQENKLNPGWNE